MPWMRVRGIINTFMGGKELLSTIGYFFSFLLYPHPNLPFFSVWEAFNSSIRNWYNTSVMENLSLTASQKVENKEIQMTVDRRSNHCDSRMTTKEWTEFLWRCTNFNKPLWLSIKIILMLHFFMASHDEITPRENYQILFKFIRCHVI